MVDLDEAKLYCKIDFDFEDELLQLMIESAEEQICFAIKDGSNQKILRTIQSLKWQS